MKTRSPQIPSCHTLPPKTSSVSSSSHHSSSPIRRNTSSFVTSQTTSWEVRKLPYKKLQGLELRIWVGFPCRLWIKTLYSNSWASYATSPSRKQKWIIYFSLSEIAAPNFYHDQSPYEYLVYYSKLIWDFLWYHCWSMYLICDGKALLCFFSNDTILLKSPIIVHGGLPCFQTYFDEECHKSPSITSLHQPSMIFLHQCGYESETVESGPTSYAITMLNPHLSQLYRPWRHSQSLYSS